MSLNVKLMVKNRLLHFIVWQTSGGCRLALHISPTLAAFYSKSIKDIDVKFAEFVVHTNRFMFIFSMLSRNVKLRSSRCPKLLKMKRNGLHRPTLPVLHNETVDLIVEFMKWQFEIVKTVIMLGPELQKKKKKDK